MSGNVREEMAQTIAPALFEGEDAIELALARTAKIIVTISESRSKAALSVLHGQEAMEQAAELATSLLKARRDIAVFHRHLEVAGRAIGIDTKAFGDVGKPPEARTAIRPAA